MNPETIDYIESDGNYVTIRSGNANYISRDTIKRLSADLAHVGFIRIERSLLVNIRAIAYVETVGRGMFAFTLSSGSVLHSSSSYRDSILRMLPMRRLSMRRQVGRALGRCAAAASMIISIINQYVTEYTNCML